MKLTFTLIALCFYCLLNAQKAGTLDSSFGKNGKVTTGKIGFFPQATCSAAMSDGSIVVGGTITTDSLLGGFFACKYSLNGIFDTSFGRNGIAVIHNLQYAEAIAVQPDNKIVICGYGIGWQSYFICIGRLNPDGRLDSSFGTNGTIITVAGENSHDIAIQPDGKILIAGSTGTSFLILRYLPNGTLDSSFGENGEVLTNLGVASAQAISVLPDGKILVLGETIDHNVFARYNADGSSDLTFGVNGIIKFFRNDERGLSIEGFYDMILQPDNKILIGGVKEAVGIQDSVLIKRFMPGGTPDSSFGDNGRMVNSFGYSCIATRVALGKNGKIVIGGYITDMAYKHHFLVERYKPDGSVDITFGDNGHQVTKMGKTDASFGLIIQDDGKIVLTGDAENNLKVPTADGIALARYNSNNYQKNLYSRQYDQSKISQPNCIIYPNPSQNILHVEGLSTMQAKLTVVDFAGNIKLQAIVNASSFNLNIASLHAGNYLLKIETNGEVVTKQFLKE